MKATVSHYCPHDRPIHPACAKLSDRQLDCTCTLEFGGWDGRRSTLGEAVRAARVKEARAVPHVLSGQALQSLLPLDSITTLPDADEEMVSDSFWSNAEFLLTIDKNRSKKL